MHPRRIHFARKAALALVVAAGLIACFPPPAFAYIDPASGSFILQMLLAVFFSAMFMLKRLRTRIVVFFKTLMKKKSTNEPAE